MAGSQVLSVYMRTEKIIVACRTAIYVKSESTVEGENHFQSDNCELNTNIVFSDEMEDLFETSRDVCLDETFKEGGDTNNEHNLMENDAEANPNINEVYKYKRPTMAYNLEGEYLYSLHSQPSKCSNISDKQNRTEKIYVECCCIKDFSCASSCLGPFNASPSELNVAYWICSYRIKNLNRKFLNKYFSLYNSLFENSPEVLLLFVFCAKISVRVIIIEESQEENKVIEKGVVDISLELNHPISLYHAIDHEKIPKNSKSEDISDFIDDILSSQCADARSLSINLDPWTITQIFTQDQVGKNSVLVLFFDGTLVHYRKLGKELDKWKLPIGSIIYCTFDTDNNFYALSSSGILYKCGDLQSTMSEIVMNPDRNANTLVQTFIDLTDSMEIVNQQNISLQETIRQLKIFASVNQDPEYLRNVMFHTDVEMFSTNTAQHQHRVALTISQFQDEKILVQFWSVQVTIEIPNKAHGQRRFVQHVAKFPASFQPGCSWKIHIDISGSIEVESFPLRLSVAFLLNLDTKSGVKQLKSNNVHEKNITPLHFVFVKSSVTKKGATNQHLLSVVEPSANLNSFQEFLSNINETRPIHQIFNSLEPKENFSQDIFTDWTKNLTIELTENKVKRMAENYQLFAEIRKIITHSSAESASSNNVVELIFLEYELYATIALSYKDGETNIVLILNDYGRTDYLMTVKYDLLNSLRLEMEHETKDSLCMKVPYNVIERVENIKKEIEALNLEDNPENIAKYKKLYDNWRTILSNVISSVYSTNKLFKPMPC